MGKKQDLDSTQNLVHPDWEILDPTPDIFALFPLFDRKFFQSRLSCVVLEWSKKMYNCAGICYQRSNRLGKSCIIRLSEPLLKLRPRKDLIQTLLHEMIHAYCFVLGIREGNGGHGPTFKKIMNGINKIAGTNITVYHSFHDEVDLYKTHWWKCNGPCQNRHPFFGLVKRTTNRKPGTYDFWWNEHQLTCGGEFIKIREPSPKRKRANKENNLGFLTPSQSKPQGNKTKSITSSQQGNVISNYFNNSNSSSSGSAIRTPSVRSVQPKKTYTPGAKPNFGGGTLVVRKPAFVKTSSAIPKPSNLTAPILASMPAKPSSTSVPNIPCSSRAEENLHNVKQLKDISSVDEKPPISLFSGKGFALGSISTSGPGERKSRLLDKFPSSTTKPSKLKKPRTEEKPSTSNASSVETVLLSDDSDSFFDEIDLEQIEKTAANIKKERQEAIKQEIMDSSTGEEMEDIILIDDDYDDELESIDDAMLDRSVIDELFNESDELIEDFNRTNANVKVEKPDDEIVSCPMCLKKMARPKVGDHLEICYSTFFGEESPINTQQATIDSLPTSTNMDKPSTSKGTTTARKSSTTPCAQTKRPSEADSDLITARQKLLRDCGYTDTDISRVLEDASEDDISAPDLPTLRQQVLRDCGYTEADIARALDDAAQDEALDNDVEIISAVDNCDCPVCGRSIALDAINRHLDHCLLK